MSGFVVLINLISNLAALFNKRMFPVFPKDQCVFSYPFFSFKHNSFLLIRLYYIRMSRRYLYEVSIWNFPSRINIFSSFLCFLYRCLLAQWISNMLVVFKYSFNVRNYCDFTFIIMGIILRIKCQTFRSIFTLLSG